MTAPETNIATQQQSNTDARCSALHKPFYLAGWRVEPALNKVRNASAGERHLEPRLMKLLCFLAANQGEVLSRDELVTELWPHVIVNENSLTRAVSELRKHLAHETLDTRDLIQTVPKRGYLLTQTIEALDNDRPDTLSAAEPPSDGALAADESRVAQTPAARPSAAATALGKPWQLLQQPLAAASTAAALSICLTLAVGFDYRAAETVSSPTLASLQDEVVSADLPLYGAQISLSSAWSDTLPAGTIEKPALAADGERFAFIKHDITGSAIYLGELDSEESPMMVFQGPCEISNLTWSPLGDALLFAREPTLTPAAAFNAHAGGQVQRELFSLNLQTLELSKLVEDATQEAGKEAPKSSLTFSPVETANSAQAVEPV